MEKDIEALVKKAAAADKSEDAMRYAQAALNAANAFIGLTILNRKEK